jgi:hypothetical protein
MESDLNSFEFLIFVQPVFHQQIYSSFLKILIFVL